MKSLKLVILLFVLLLISFPADAAEKRSERWDNLIEISYKFTWYPRKDLQELLAQKGMEYEQTIEEYQNILVTELTDGSVEGRSIDPELFVTPKPWKLYYRLAIAEFCSFLAHDDKIHLENAISVFSVISDKKELTTVSFWYYLFHSYDFLIKKDRDSFVKSVYQLWQNAIMQLEINNMMIKSEKYELQLFTDISYFYENISHLIITKAVIEYQLSDLYELAGIIVSLRYKLTLDNGYKRFVEAIVERLQGLKSDNNNLNFAVAFVEATAYQNEFEEEKSKQLIVEKYNSARLFYDLALSWANTHKGKAAILTQHMGFYNYIVRRLVDKDSLLTASPVFLDVPREASQLVDSSIELYDKLAKSSTRENGFVQDGFRRKYNYLEGMHQLWDSSTKLLMTLSLFHKMSREADKRGETNIAEGLLLKYLSFFRRYTQEDKEIVPDNAFFLAAYAATQLSALYTEAEQISTGILDNNLAFVYQLQAVELFPLDIVGILKLAYQTNQENRPRLYFQYVAPLSSRLRDSRVALGWLDKNPGNYRNTIGIVTNVTPNIIENAFLFINLLQQAEGSQTEDDLYNKLIIMETVFAALKTNGMEEMIQDTLVLIAKLDLPNDNKSINKFVENSLPSEIRKIVAPIPELKGDGISRLRNELYASPDSKIHSFLRELYFEIPVATHQYFLFHQRLQKYL